MISQFTTPEPVTAIVTLPVAGEQSEQFIGPIVIGYYPGSDGEVYIQQENERVQIPAAHFAAVIRELKRAHKIAIAQKGQP